MIRSFRCSDTQALYESGESRRFVSIARVATRKLALLDAACLAQRIIESDDTSTAVAAFETEMFARVEEAANESTDAAATFLSHDSLALTLASYQERLARMQAMAIDKC